MASILSADIFPVVILPPSMEVVPLAPRSEAFKNVVNPVKSILSALILMLLLLALETSCRSAYTFVPIVLLLYDEDSVIAASTLDTDCSTAVSADVFAYPARSLPVTYVPEQAEMIFALPAVLSMYCATDVFSVVVVT